MSDERLLHVVAEYRNRGIAKYGELLLEPQDMIELLEQLASIEILVIGCECWRYVNREEKTAYELPGGGYAVEYDIPYLEMTASASADVITKFLRERESLSYHYDLVALHFNEPEIHDLFFMD